MQGIKLNPQLLHIPSTPYTKHAKQKQHTNKDNDNQQDESCPLKQLCLEYMRVLNEYY